jgi:hypothetical protein
VGEGWEGQKEGSRDKGGEEEGAEKKGLISISYRKGSGGERVTRLFNLWLEQ